MIRRLSNIAVAASLFVVIASVAGQWLNFHIQWNGWTCYGFRGSYAIYRTARMVPSPDGPGVQWFDLALPFGLLFVILTIGHPLARWSWKTRTDDARRCHQCSYNLTGNTSGVCPECGAPV